MADQSEFKRYIREQIRKSTKCLANLIPGLACGLCFSKECTEKTKDILLDHDVLGPTSAYSHEQLLELAGLLLCKRTHRRSYDEALVRIWTSRFSILVPLTQTTGISSSLCSDGKRPPAPHSKSSDRDGGLTLENFDETSHGSLPERRVTEESEKLKRKQKGRLSDVPGPAVLFSSPLRNVGSETPFTTPARNHNKGQGYVEEVDTPNTQYSDIWTPDPVYESGAITPNTPNTSQNTQDFSEDPESPCPGPYSHTTRLDRTTTSPKESALTGALPVRRSLFQQPPTSHRSRKTSNVPKPGEPSTASAPLDVTIVHTLRSRCIASSDSAPDRFQLVSIHRSMSLSDILTRAFKNDNPAGYVYVYTCPNAPGHVKIGFTRKEPKKRLNRIKTQCRYKDEPVLCEDPFQRVVSNVRRLEALVHAELNSCRKRQVVCGCPQKHEEWFEIEPELAVAVVEKWRRWMEMEPYGADMKLKSNWKLQVDLLFGGQKKVDRDCPSLSKFLEGKLEWSGQKAQEEPEPTRGSVRITSLPVVTRRMSQEKLQRAAPVVTNELLLEAIRVLQARLARVEAFQSRNNGSCSDLLGKNPNPPV